MSWNYRVCKQRYHYTFAGKKRKEIIFSVREVHYDSKGKNPGWGEARKLDSYGDRKELIAALELMLKDAKRRKVLWIGVDKSGLLPPSIRTKKDHKIALARIAKLMALDPMPDTEKGRELNSLADLVEDYEKKKFPI